LAGFSATTITHPFDMLKTRMQLKPQNYPNIWLGALKILKVIMYCFVLIFYYYIINNFLNFSNLFMLFLNNIYFNELIVYFVRRKDLLGFLMG